MSGIKYSASGEDNIVSEKENDDDDDGDEEEAKVVGEIVSAEGIDQRIARGDDYMMELKGRCIEAAVTSVSKCGFFMKCGGLELFVHYTHMPEDLIFDDEHRRFVCYAENIGIQVGSLIRARVIGIRSHKNEWVSIGTINEDYLGPVDETSLMEPAVRSHKFFDK